MSRHTVISADCHAGASYAHGGFLEYIDPPHRDRAAQEMERLTAQHEARSRLFAEAFMQAQDGTQAAMAGGRSGAWDAERRCRELDGDGIAGEVIFPDGSQNNAAPFQAAEGPGAVGADHPLQSVGAWAYNRWLADLCATEPERHAGLIVITIHDVDEALAQVRWGADHGLRGVLLPAGVGDLPFYHHPRYEPLWSLCEERRLPLHTHVGSATPDYGELPGSIPLFAYESLWFSHRPLWFLIWGGVFERHPELRVVFAEQGAEWVPDTLLILDRMYEGVFRHEQKRLSMAPSAYWRRQCYVQAQFLGEREIELRHEIGVHNMLWGSDYPHYEGTWPRSKRAIQKNLAGIPAAEARAILCGNAAAVYGFDLAALDRLGARIGPEL